MHHGRITSPSLKATSRQPSSTVFTLNLPSVPSRQTCSASAFDVNTQCFSIAHWSTSALKACRRESTDITNIEHQRSTIHDPRYSTWLGPDRVNREPSPVTALTFHIHTLIIAATITGIAQTSPKGHPTDTTTPQHSNRATQKHSNRTQQQSNTATRPTQQRHNTETAHLRGRTLLQVAEAGSRFSGVVLPLPGGARPTHSYINNPNVVPKTRHSPGRW